jgi:hypothetical protein
MVIKKGLMMFKNAILKLQAIFGFSGIELVFTCYYTNGPKQMKGFMKNGKKEGYWAYWDLEGTLIKREWYKNGAVVH